MSDNSKSLAELAAMRARGELTSEQFEEAKRVLLNSNSTDNQQAPTRQSLALPKTKMGCGPIVLGFIAVVTLIGWLGGSKDKETSSEQLAADAEKKQNGFHCLSTWDGSSRELYDAVKATLRDPSSMEHVETRIAPVAANGTHLITMQFRAKNGFGGMNVSKAVGRLRNSDCNIVDWNIVEDS
jgi:hypothetical protein